MAQSHAVTLTLGSTQTRLDVWDQYDAVVDMLRPGSPWAFTLWNSQRGTSAWQQLLSKTRLGDYVVLAIDSAPQLTGRIESRRVARSRTHGLKLIISGRDIAGPAIDWDADPAIAMRNRPLDEVMQALFKPLGVTVVIGAGASAAREVQTRQRPGARDVAATSTPRRHLVDISHPRPGERVWQVAESIVRKLGYMLWVAPSPNGELAVIVDTPNYDQAPLFALRARAGDRAAPPGSEVLESDYEAQIRDVPTIVYAMGRTPRGDTRPARHRVAAQNTGLFNLRLDPLVRDIGTASLDALGLSLSIPGSTPPTSEPPEVTPAGNGAPIATRLGYRNAGLTRSSLVIDPLPPQPRYLHTTRARNPATGKQEAERVLAEAMAHFRTYSCIVQGHGQRVDGRPLLFAVNTMARVEDDYAEIDEPMLITRVQFSGNRDEGQLTKLTLGQKGAIALFPSST